MAYNTTSLASFMKMELPPEPSPLSTMIDSFVLVEQLGLNVSGVINDSDAKMETEDTTMEDQAPTDDFYVSSDLSLGEMQEKMIEIMKENDFLKARIAEINTVMNSQFENISAWTENLYQNKDQKDLIEVLKKKNRFLTNELEELKIRKEVQDDEVTTLTQNLAKLRQNNRDTAKDLEIHKKELEETKRVNQNFRDELELLRKSKDHETTVLKQAITQLNQSCNDNVNNMEQKEKTIEELNKDNRNLTKEIEHLTIRNANQDEELSTLRETLAKLNQAHEDDLKTLGLADKEIAELKTKLIEIKCLNDKQQKSLAKQIDTMRSQLMQNNGRPSNEDVNKIREQLNNAKVVLMHLEQSKVIADGQIEALNKEILDLRAKLQDSQKQTNDLNALKTQLDIFQADFDAEKSMKRRIQNENQKLSEEVHVLRMHCQQLQEEVGALRGIQVSSRSRRGPPSEHSSTTPNSVHHRKCPICNFGFHTDRELHNHVERCIRA